MESITLDKIICDSNRKYTKDEGFEQLLNSINAIGIIEPPVVRRIDDGKYRVVAGRRRVAAARELNMARIDCIVREDDEDKVIRITDEQIALSENVNRQEMHPLDEAAAFKKMAEFGASVEEIAKYYARSPSAIYKRLRLSGLAEELKGMFRDGKLNIASAAVLAELPEGDQKEFFVFYGDEEEEIEHGKISQFIFKSQKHTIEKSMKGCEGCTKRTHNEDNKLFLEFENLTDVCLDADCYRVKWHGMISCALEAEIVQMNEAGVQTDNKMFFENNVPEEMYKKASKARFGIEKKEVEFEVLRDKDYDRTGTTNRKKDACWLIHTDMDGNINISRVGYKARPPREKTAEKGAAAGKNIDSDSKDIDRYGRKVMKAVAEELQLPSAQVLHKNLCSKRITNGWDFKDRISKLVIGRVIARRIEEFDNDPPCDYLEILMKRLDEDCCADHPLDGSKFDERQKEWLQKLFCKKDIKQIWAGISDDARNILHFLLLSLGFSDAPDLDEVKEIVKKKKTNDILWNYACMGAEEYEALYLEAAKEVAAEALKPKEKKGAKKKNAGGKKGNDGVRKCRVCGCTDDDCSQCVEKTGEPCHWVEEDLCSACADEGGGEDDADPDIYVDNEGE
jgi:ParB/RepB/Spo0J family partition protein